MFAAVLIAPATSRDEFGVVFMDAYGYPNMCGHATIGVAPPIQQGLIEVPSPLFADTSSFAYRRPQGALRSAPTLKMAKLNQSRSARQLHFTWAPWKWT